MTDHGSTIRRVGWQEILPWLILFRAFRISISIPVLFLATVGTFLTPLGWRLGDMLFLAEDTAVVHRAENAQWPDRVGNHRPESGLPHHVRDWYLNQTGQSVMAGVPAVFCRFVEPFAQVARGDFTVTRAAYHLFGGLWSVAVWALLAGAITRLAAVRLGCQEHLGMGSAMAHAAKNYVFYVASPLCPLLGMLLLAAPIAVMGLLVRTSIGAVIAGLLWPLCLLAGFLLAIMVIGLSFGWPLMWPTISSEQGGDIFEAFSRSYSYTFQRPLHYLFFAIFSVGFGAVCWLFVFEFSWAVVQLTQWAASWGSGSARLEQLVSGDMNGWMGLGGNLIHFWTAIVETVATAFNYSYFFCSATAIYLLLRLQVDQTEFDEIVAVDQQHRHGLTDVPQASPAEELTEDQRETVDGRE